MPESLHLGNWQRSRHPPRFCPETTGIFPGFARVNDMAAGDSKGGVTLAKGIFAMDNRASGRLALTVAAAFLLAAITTKPLQACENCAPSDAATVNKAANALPTYPEATEEVAAPVALKKFTKSQSRSARSAPSRSKASLAQRASAGKIAARKASEAAEVDSAQARPPAKVTYVVANAKAELVAGETAKAAAAEASPPATAETPAARADVIQPPSIQLVEAEEFNELDRAAWETNQMPKLMKLITTGDSRAEMREDDSKWAQTSTIGKLFVAFGALLTLGSAIRMFMA
jgi:hypothetical protein